MPLTASQIAQLAANAGFSGSELGTATAIALAESGGNPSVIGDTNITPGGSIGLWQINLAAHPEYSAADLMDPQANANAAYNIFQQSGSSFTPWTTFNTGAYSAFASNDSSADLSSDDLSDTSVSLDPNVLIVGILALVVGAAWWVDA